MIRAVGFVVFAQFLAEAMNLYTGNGILRGIEALRAVENLDGYVVFLDLIDFALEILCAEVG